MSAGRLYLIPVPITEGDPALTLPGATPATARACRRFLAENAKSARAFLKACAHPLPIAELEIIEIGHVPEAERFGEWLAPILAGTDTAIVSESGCPAVADPGADLVRAAQGLGIEVVPLVGPSSILLTLMASGMNGQRFRFLGYLPVHEDERRAAIVALEKESRATGETELFIETPYRNNRILEALAQTLSPETRISAATDVTGRAQSIVTLTAAQWLKKGGELPKLPTVFAVQAAGRSTGSSSGAVPGHKALVQGRAPHKSAQGRPGREHSLARARPKKPPK